ncbi:hypothetical protein [Nitriliruptor alkaliphilus]|uniref:hypothetical protein n=1 Tax=Nitriliruptor alkaliphilus TaxID=427918 RepID=UPI000698BFC4|nr:hypothetical protein [Nitriliruptor alkaliphilus]
MSQPPHDLDQLLHAWAGRQRLDHREAASIRAAIVASPGGAVQPSNPPATWWADLSARVTATVVQATTQPPPVVPSPV